MDHHFENFKATLTTLSPTISILDWKAPDTQMYSVHVVMDGNHAFLSGDLGTAVIEMSSPVTLRQLEGFYRCPEYFMEKLRLSTDRYWYNHKEAADRLNKEIYVLSKRMDEDQQEELQEAADDLLRSFTTEFGLASECAILDRWYDFQPIEDALWMHFAGRHLAPRVKLWLEAFHEAYLQLTKEEN